MNPDSNIEKIKKLLRLAKSPNQHEAQLAMQRAVQLAAKHAVDLADLAEGEEVPADNLTHEWTECSLRVSREHRYAVSVAQGYFHVTCCYGRGKLLFIGRSEDIQIAQSIIAYLVKASRAGLARFAEDEADYRRRMTPNKRISYVDAFYSAIHQKMIGEIEQLKLDHERFALVLADQKQARTTVLDEAVPERTSKLIKKPTRRNVTATTAGWIDGRKAKLMEDLQAPKPTQTQLALL